MRKLVNAAVIVVVLPFLIGAAVAMPNITPNPGGAANKIKGDGTWSLAVGETFVRIRFEVTLKGSMPVQVTGADATVDVNVNPKTWASTLTVAAAKYNPTKVTFTYMDATKTPQSVSVTDNNDQTVK